MMAAQKSKASSRLRSALRWRSRRYRRGQVLWFYLAMLAGAATTLGGDHRNWRELAWALLFPAICASVALKEWSRWSYSRWRCVSSLDDRAQAEYGLNFEQLSGGEQKEILRRYQVGRRLLDETPDERQEAARLRALDVAFRFLRKALIGLAVGYEAVWLWAPAGPLRDMLTDSPVIIAWLVVFVISLPQVIEMWSEPEEMSGEPRVMEGHR
jgi:hypothetical protein